MTLDDLELSVKTSKPSLYIRFDDLEVNSKIVLEAVQQIKRSVTLIQSGISSPSDHRAEVVLMLILTNAIRFHGVGKENANG